MSAEFIYYDKDIAALHSWVDKARGNQEFRQCIKCNLYAYKSTNTQFPYYYLYSAPFLIVKSNQIRFIRNDDIVHLTCDELVLRQILE